jgi:peptidoglycan pentaglycine glycine transferase (the first glycine)
MIGAMVSFKIQKFTADAWKNTVSEFEGHSLLQTWEYAEAKSVGGLWTVERGLFTRSGKTVGAAQVMIRRLPLVGGGLVWVNRGPLGGSVDASFTDMALALKETYVDQRGFYLRIAPSLVERGLNIDGFTLAGEAGWASAILDLSPAAEDLRKGLKQKWRNGLNKAERSGFEVAEGTSPALFHTFLGAHTEFTNTKGFDTGLTPQFLQNLNELLPKNCKLYALVASLDGKIAGSALIARFGNTGEYLAGNTTDTGRKLSAGQLLLWGAVEALKEKGVGYFDLGGMDDVLTPLGIYKFKEGLGGTPYRLAPEIEFGGDTIRGRLVRWRVNRARAGN